MFLRNTCTTHACIRFVSSGKRLRTISFVFSLLREGAVSPLRGVLAGKGVPPVEPRFSLLRHSEAEGSQLRANDCAGVANQMQELQSRGFAARAADTNSRSDHFHHHSPTL